MTPKAKAKQLFSQFNFLLPIDSKITDTISQANEKMISDHITAKKCVLLHIYLTIELIKQSNLDGGNTLKYWDKVSDEINKL